MNRKHDFKINMEIFLTLAACIGFYFLLDRIEVVREYAGLIFRILRPFLIGGVIAYLLTPLCNCIEQWLQKAFSVEKMAADKQKRTRSFIESCSIFSSLLLFCVMIYGLMALLVPQLYNNLMLLFNMLPEYLSRVERQLDALKQTNPAATDYIYNQIDAAIVHIYDFLRNDILPNMSNIISGVKTGISGVLSWVKDFMIGLVAAIYLMASRRTLRTQMTMLVYAIFPSSLDDREGVDSSKRSIGDRILEECAVMNQYMGGFIKGKILDSLIIGLICLAFTWIAGIPYAVLVSVIVGVTNIIPFFGPFIGAIPSTLLILVIDPMKSLIFVVFVIFLQQLDGNVIGPKILGSAINLSTFWILFAIMAFGGLFGLTGMILGVPVFGFIYHLLRDWVHSRPAVKKYLEKSSTNL